MAEQNPASSVKVFGIIPARYASTRMPGKPLTPIAGRAMIQHVVERTRQASRVARVVVATDDDRIKKAVEDFGGEAILTRRDHRSGTDRVAEIAAHLEAEIYVDIQGDEPLIEPGTIDAVVAEMLDDDSIQIATPCTAITQPNDVMDPNIVKVVRDFDGNCLYFSRAPIPWVRDTKAAAAPHHWKHVGLYAFRRDALLEYPTLPPGELEAVEHLEQLRWLENGFHIRAIETDYDAISVDVPADIQRVEKILQERAAAS
jgi:3-deoxy-manno-octulosonate cytidylyltransferase (CMP-KDO synthetase)